MIQNEKNSKENSSGMYPKSGNYSGTPTAQSDEEGYFLR
jgi:hypothetical protein